MTLSHLLGNLAQMLAVFVVVGLDARHAARRGAHARALRAPAARLRARLAPAAPPRGRHALAALLALLCGTLTTFAPFVRVLWYTALELSSAGCYTPPPVGQLHMQLVLIHYSLVINH